MTVEMSWYCGYAPADYFALMTQRGLFPVLLDDKNLQPGDVVVWAIEPVRVAAIVIRELSPSEYENHLARMGRSDDYSSLDGRRPLEIRLLD